MKKILAAKGPYATLETEAVNSYVEGVRSHPKVLERIHWLIPWATDIAPRLTTVAQTFLTPKGRPMCLAVFSTFTEFPAQNISHINHFSEPVERSWPGYLILLYNPKPLRPVAMAWVRGYGTRNPIAELLIETDEKVQKKGFRTLLSVTALAYAKYKKEISYRKCTGVEESIVLDHVSCGSITV